MTVGLIAPEDDAKNKRLYPSRAFKKLTSGLSDANIAYDVTYAFVGLDNVKKQLSNLFSYAKLPSVETDGKVEIIEAKNIMDEMEYVAKNIRRAVIEQKLRYKDFAVVVPSSDDYENDVRNVFTRYDVPYFWTKKYLFRPRRRQDIFCRRSGARPTASIFRTSTRLSKIRCFTKPRKGTKACNFLKITC